MADQPLSHTLLHNKSSIKLRLGGLKSKDVLTKSNLGKITVFSDLGVMSTYINGNLELGGISGESSATKKPGGFRHQKMRFG